MRQKNCVHSRSDGCLKWRKLDSPQATGITVYGSYHLMGIHRRVPQTRKVLRCYQEAMFVSPADESRDQASNLFRVFAERSVVDHRVRRIAVHVGNGGQCPLDPHRAGLLRRHGAELFGLTRFAYGAEGHGPREIGHILQPRGDAPFQI